MKARLVLWDITNINNSDLLDATLIGVDRGALNLISHGIHPDISIGDFDSVSKDEYKLIEKNSKTVVKLNPIKDKTDTEEAINLVKNYDEIMILGGIKGKRIEHFYANLMLIKNNPKVIIKDDNSLIEYKDKSFIPRSGYKYISLFPIDDEVVISISGMKYNLFNYHLKQDNPTLGISNEIKDNPYIEIISGRLFVFYSMEDHENI